MHESSHSARIICNDHELTDQLRQLLVRIAPDCEVLSAPSDCSVAPFCRWLGDAQLGAAGRIQVALIDATDVLESTRHAFKSRELGLLRRRLVALLEQLPDNPD